MNWPRSLRFRLAAWYMAAILLSLGGFAGLTGLALKKALLDRVHGSLQERVVGLQRFLAHEIDGSANSERLKVAIKEEILEFTTSLPAPFDLRVWDIDGKPLYDRPGGVQQSLAADPAGFHTEYLPDGPNRTLSTRVFVNGKPYAVEMSMSLADEEQVLASYRQITFWLVPLLVALAGSLGIWLSKRALQPVDELTTAARTIGLTNLSSRLPTLNTGDELQRLTEAWNDMLERLERSVQQISQFTADASHELRTPLSVIRASAELALRRERSVTEYQQFLQQILQAVGQTTSMVEDLLLLARAESASRALSIEPFELRSLTRSVVASVRPLAERKTIAVKARLEGMNVWVDGNANSIQRAVAAVLQNALKYTHSGGTVTVGLDVNGWFATVRITDTGIGISPSDLPHIFERFYRADRARTAEEGWGLGLAITRKIIETHQGEIEVTSQPERGTEFLLRLPRSAQSEVLDKSPTAGISSHSVTNG